LVVQTEISHPSWPQAFTKMPVVRFTVNQPVDQAGIDTLGSTAHNTIKVRVVIPIAPKLIASDSILAVVQEVLGKPDMYICVGKSDPRSA
jgi:hypothetical protein